MKDLLDFLRRSRPIPPSPYDLEDIRAARARGEPPPLIEFGRELSAGKLGDRILAFLASKEAPSVDDPLFHLAAPRKGSFEVWPIDGERHLVAFTSPRRLNHSRAATPGLPRTPWILTVSASKISGGMPGIFKVGLTGFALNPCPYCPTVNVLSPSALTDPRVILEFWAVERLTRNDSFERFLDKGRQALAAGRAEEALGIGQHMVTHLDAERPEVHLLLGECGVRLGDTKLVIRKLEILRLFGEPWPTRLQEIAGR